jgi:hypothetical protein
MLKQNFQPRISCVSSENILQNEETFLEKSKFKESFISRPTLKEWIKKVLQTNPYAKGF